MFSINDISIIELNENQIKSRIRDVQKEIEAAAKSMNFMKAAKLRDTEKETESILVKEQIKWEENIKQNNPVTTIPGVTNGKDIL